LRRYYDPLLQKSQVVLVAGGAHFFMGFDPEAVLRSAVFVAADPEFRIVL
jgi:hypothetical protein